MKLRGKKRRESTTAKFNKTKDPSLLEKIKKLDRAFKLNNVKRNIFKQKMKSRNSKAFWNTLKRLQGNHKTDEAITLNVEDKSINNPS
jgi:hypothetical protein